MAVILVDCDSLSFCKAMKTCAWYDLVGFIFLVVQMFFLLFLLVME